jgi:pimeloyl-ACP methyl ester carboxylesterase
MAEPVMIQHLDFGDPDGFPILYCHGTPGSAVECSGADAAARRHRLRLIAVDRPGYGWAAPAREMSHGAWADRTARFLGELGIGRYGVLGISGGAPSALALAATDKRHVVAIGLVCPLGPCVEPQLALSTGALVRWMLRMARRRMNALDWLALRPLAAAARGLPSVGLTVLRWSNAPTDRRTLARPDVARILNSNLRRAFRQGRAGMVRDLQLMLRPWDFRLGDVAAPVKLWHGRDDALLLPAHARWLAGRLAHAELVLVEAEGHFSLPFGRIETILSDLAVRCQPKQAAVSP